MKVGTSITLLLTMSLTNAFSFKSFGKELKNGLELGLNYIIPDTNLSFKDPGDFSGESVLTYELTPGASLKFSCGTKETRRNGLITMHPENPIQYSLAPLNKNSVEESLNRTIRNFDLFRSDKDLIHTTGDMFGGVYLIQHPMDTVIVSPKAELILNIACVYYIPDNEIDHINEHKQKLNHLLYKWIQIKFTNVFPMSYGCGSGNKPLFSNLSPTNDMTKIYGEPLHSSSRCEITPAPGMVVGIYCKEKETFKDDLCFKDLDGKTYYDLTFEHTNAAGRLHLFRVPKEGFGRDISFLCECKNKFGETTSFVKLVSVSEYVCDFGRIFKISSNQSPNLSVRKATLERIIIQSCKRDLHPGERLRLIMPPEGSKITYDGHDYNSTLNPALVESTTYIQSLKDTDIQVEGVRKLIISTGFSINKYKVDDHYEYIFNFEKNGIVILKTEIASLNYYWVLSRGPKGKTSTPPRIEHSPNIYNRFSLDKVGGIVSVGLVPTDPYTHGCGLRNDLFRKELVSFQTQQVGQHLASHCVVDGVKHSPIGFYCPKPHRLIPNNCFSSMLISNGEDEDETNKSDATIELSSLVEHFNAFKSMHLTVLEVYSDIHPDATTSFAENPETDANKQRLMCKCVDASNNVLASITVLIDPRHNSEANNTTNSGDGVDHEMEEYLAAVKNIPLA